jgi:hypothetical protein
MYDQEKKIKMVIDHYPIKPHIKPGPEINNRQDSAVIVIEKGQTSDRKDEALQSGKSQNENQTS